MSALFCFSSFIIIFVICIIYESIKKKHLKIPVEIWPLYFFELIIGNAIPKYLANEKLIPQYGYWRDLSILSGTLVALAFLFAGIKLLLRPRNILMDIKNSRIPTIIKIITDEEELDSIKRMGIIMTTIGILFLIIGIWLTFRWIIDFVRINGLMTQF